MPRFLNRNPRLDISVRLLDSIKASETDVKIYESKIIGKGKKILTFCFINHIKTKNHFTNIFG